MPNTEKILFVRYGPFPQVLSHIVRVNVVLIRRRSVILKLLPELFVYVYVALRRALQPRFTAAVKIPLPRQHFTSRILFDRKLSESYFF